MGKISRKGNRLCSLLLSFVLATQLIIPVQSEEAITESETLTQEVDDSNFGLTTEFETNAEEVLPNEDVVVPVQDVEIVPEQESSTIPEGSTSLVNDLIEEPQTNTLFVFGDPELSEASPPAKFISPDVFPLNSYGVIESIEGAEKEELLKQIGNDVGSSVFYKANLYNQENQEIREIFNIRVYFDDINMESTLYVFFEDNSVNTLPYSTGEDEDGTYIEYAFVDAKCFAFVESSKQPETVPEIILNNSSEEIGLMETEPVTEAVTEPATEEVTESIAETEEETEEETELPIEETETETEVLEEVTESITPQLSYEGSTFSVSVYYSEASEIPDNAYLRVNEIKENSQSYEGYLDITKSIPELSNLDFDSAQARFFDITILYKDENNEETEFKITDSVSVEISYKDYNASDNVSVVHFEDDSSEATLIPSTVVENTISEGSSNSIVFDATSFSVYGIVDAPDVEIETNWKKITSLQELEEHSDDGFYISHVLNFFITTNPIVIANPRVGLKRFPTSRESSVTPDLAQLNDGMLCHVLKQSDSNYYIYYKSGDNWIALIQDGNSLKLTDPIDVSQTVTDEDRINLLSAAGATCFTFSKFTNNSTDIWRVEGQNNYCINLKSGTTGNAFATHNNRTDTNAQLNFWYFDSEQDDPFGLDGKTYGITCFNGDITAYGLTSTLKTSGSDTTLSATQMSIKPQVIADGGVLVIDANGELTDWTFTNIGGNRYYLSTVINGTTKYLSMSDTSVFLSDVPSDSSIVTVRNNPSGNGSYQFTVGSNILNYSKNLSKGFAPASWSSNLGYTAWLYLAEEMSNLTNDDIVPYTAHIVNISDREAVPDGQQVIMYVSLWNTVKLKYDHYIIDYNGYLRPCYEIGGTLSWYGNQANTALWDFTEYHWEGTDDPNFYYELQNVYSGKYLAPQYSADKIFSDDTVGINMSGRRYGDSSTTIISWDEDHYSYASIAVDKDRMMVVPGVLANAQEVSFAIMDDPEVAQLTREETIDNDDFNISIRMVDFNNTIVNNRDSGQTDILGYDTNPAGLVLPYLGEDGYPITNPSATGKPQTSLSTLFAGATPANNLFIKSAYEELGYFTFDSTENCAVLGEDGNFIVYDQLAGIGTSTVPSRTHGQFMPYNTITAGNLSRVTNQTDVLGNTLSDLNPRKGEPLYLIPQDDADYFFGMELDASFVQSKNGLDTRGNDIIFEFSGDDDFWLFIDGQLALDIGGVHSASTGSINFRTGTVEYHVRGSGATAADPPGRTKTTTLYEVFRENYLSTHSEASQSEVEEYLNGIFKVNSEGQHVFKDYTSHSLKMFYMERGAGASNLKMRFNVTSIPSNTVILGKNLSGTDRAKYIQAQFPFQVYYKSTIDGGALEHLLDYTNASGDYNVTYFEKNEPVPFRQTYTPTSSLATYDNVFFLKDSDRVEIHLPSDATQYRIQECGINSKIYDEVKINNVVMEGIDTGYNVLDYSCDYSTVESRQSVDFTNHIKGTALRNLNFTKHLYNVSGQHLLTSSDDNGKFSFRLYLCDEITEEPTLAYLQEYFVKNENLEYCKWNKNAKTFESVGITSIDSSTPESLLNDITFVTSPNGSISSIPAGYTIEVKDILVGTKFKIEERPEEIPKGYRFMNYECVEGSYEVRHGHINEGTVVYEENPEIIINNKVGWGISAKKEWSDSAFTTYHDTINLGIYVNGTLVEDSIKTIQHGQSSVYWYFDDLLPNTTFEDYEVKEVIFDGTTATPLEEGESITVNAVPVGEALPEPFNYIVSYERGTPSSNSPNVRTDIVKNTRPGIKIVKEDLNGNPLRGSVFSLKDSRGDDVAAETYTSTSTGLVTIAYLNEGTYTLTEEKPTVGYRGLSGSIELSYSNNTVTLTGSPEDEDLYELDVTGDMPIIRVKNKQYNIKVVKEDEDGASLEGAHFAIFRQIHSIEGGVRKDYFPMTGYTDLVSDNTGLVIDGLESLSPGTYYITETSALPNYRLCLDAIFTISPNGEVTLSTGSDCSLESETINNVSAYTIHIINRLALQNLEIRKVDKDYPTTVFLDGAVFDLYRVVSGVKDQTPLYEDLTSNDDGLLETSTGETMLALNYGSYALVEKTPPTNYKRRTEDISIVVSESGVVYNDGSEYSQSGNGVHYNQENYTYTIDVTNEHTDGVLVPLKVTKQVVGINSPNTPFVFTLELSGDNLDSTYIYSHTTKNGTVTEESLTFESIDGVLTGTFELKDGEAFEINLPIGTAYTVSEEEDENFWTTIGDSTDQSSSVSNILNVSTRVDFVNHAVIIVPTATKFSISLGILILLLLMAILIALNYRKFWGES